MKKITTALLGLLLFISLVLLYLKYDIIALVRIGWKTALAWGAKLLKMLGQFIVKHTPPFFKKLLWRRLWKPLWSFLTVTILALLGPKWVARLNSAKTRGQTIARRLLTYWQNLPWYSKGGMLLVLMTALYVLGIGVLIPLFGFSLIVAGVKRLWISLTDWYLEAKTKHLRQKAIRKLQKRSALFAYSHNNWRRLRVSYRYWIRKRRQKWKNSGKQHK